jgi:hypothetical protein
MQIETYGEEARDLSLTANLSLYELGKRVTEDTYNMWVGPLIIHFNAQYEKRHDLLWKSTIFAE